MASRTHSSPSILITVEPSGGVWPQVDTLVRELSALGAEITLAALTPLYPGQRVEYSGIPGVELVACPTPVSTPAEHLANRDKIAQWLLGLEEMVNPDIIHLTGYLHAGLPWYGKVLVNGYPGTGASYGRLDAEQRRVCRAAFRYGLKGADLVVTPTETMLSALNRHFGLTRGRVIRNGRDPSRYTPSTKEAIVLSVGMLREDSTQRSALEQVAPKLPWPVVVAGEQHDENGKVVRLENVSALGGLHASQLAPWFNRASIYVALSAEGAGSWLAEAALAGCALVLGDTAALREAWNGAALFIPSGDEDALVEGLKSLMLDRRLREAMGSAVRRRGLKYPARAMAESYLDSYKELIAARAPNQFVEETSS